MHIPVCGNTSVYITPCMRSLVRLLFWTGMSWWPWETAYSDTITELHPCPSYRSYNAQNSSRLTCTGTVSGTKNVHWWLCDFTSRAAISSWQQGIKICLEGYYRDDSDPCLSDVIWEPCTATKRYFCPNYLTASGSFYFSDDPRFFPTDWPVKFYQWSPGNDSHGYLGCLKSKMHLLYHRSCYKENKRC